MGFNVCHFNSPFCLDVTVQGRVGRVDPLWPLAAGYGAQSGLLAAVLAVVSRAVGKVASVISDAWLLCWSSF